MHTRPKSRILHVDGLRALAAIWVTLSHALGMFIGVEADWRGWLVNWLQHAHAAVGIFIVLSGFCLTYPIANNLRLKKSVPEFYLGRFWRIVPPAWASVLIGAVVVGTIDLLGRQADRSVTVQSVLTNVLMLQDVFSHHNTLNAPLWSVALELKIYLFFPLLLLIGRGIGAVGMTVAGVLFGYLLTLAIASLWPEYRLIHSCPWYFALFSLGAFAAWIAENKSDRSASNMAGMIAALAILADLGLLTFRPLTGESSVAYERWLPATDLCVGVAAAAFLIYCRHSALKRWLEIKSLVWIGTASYSLYLIHLPTLFACRVVLNRIHAFADLSPYPKAFVFAAIALPAVAIATAVFFYFVERPFMRRKTKTSLTLSQTVIVSPAP